MDEPHLQAEAEIYSDLAHKLVDQVAIYGLARETAASSDVMEAIQRAKNARARLLQDIIAKIWVHGIPAIDQGTRLGAAEGAFQRLRAMTDRNDANALTEVERGEEFIRDLVTRSALDDRLTAHSRNYLQTVASRLDATREEITRLKTSHQQTAPER